MSFHGYLPVRFRRGLGVCLVVCLCTLLTMSGCYFGQGPAEFRLNMEGRDTVDVADRQREAIAETLEDFFGTPDDPKVPEDVDLDLSLLQRAAGPVYSDEEGNQFGLYRQHCVSCHGISGDGVGPTAGSQNPYPRDFRTGQFKYTSTAGGAKPAWEDLDRIIRRGVSGTAMPAFENLPDESINALIEYVKYLSIRGETELYLMRLVIDEDEYLPVNQNEVLEDSVLPTAGLWEVAEQMKVTPPPPPRPRYTSEELAASIAQGCKLFLSKNARCTTCHGESGRGDGEQSHLYDDWNKSKKRSTPRETRRSASLYQLPIQRLRPRDFTTGVFRGGSEPRDIYNRIYVGIKGTPMPAAGPATGSEGVLTPEEIWDLVNYVRSLSGIEFNDR